jgi:hypothetical protein
MKARVITKKSHAIIVAVALLALFSGATAWAQSEDVPKNLVLFAESELVRFSNDPTIIRAIEAQNAKGYSLAGIKEIDERWKATKLLDNFMFGLMSNRCSHILQNGQILYPFVVEAFVMDNKGALVGLTNKTSDYWQGDEDKFIESYKNGAGALHYGDVEFDDSIGEIVVQVSVPVMKGSTAIGAITYGISLDRWEYR